jgi:hypothetical protein
MLGLNAFMQGRICRFQFQRIINIQYFFLCMLKDFICFKGMSGMTLDGCSSIVQPAILQPLESQRAGLVG